MFSTKTIELKSSQELKIMREAGRAVAEILRILEKAVGVGVTTGELDRIAQEELKRRKCKPAFLGYRGFPAALCVSLNSEVVHGIPSHQRKIRQGDVVSMDFGCILDGFYADAAVTVGAGALAPETEKLLSVTRESLMRGIFAMKVDGRLGNISSAVQVHVEAAGFSVVRDFVGHGIGRALHEDPPVPNFGPSDVGPRLASGLVLAIEPMVNMGRPEVRVLDDGWTAVTQDGSLSAHFEHTVALTEKGPEILTEL